MSLSERLSEVDYLRQRVTALREEAFGLEHDAHRKRAKADELELEIVESLAAANILREAGLRVDRDPNGDPRVTVDRTLTPIEAGERGAGG